MSKELLKFVDINGLTTYWNNNKEYVQTKFRNKIFVGTEVEYIEVESKLEEGALVIILDEAIPNEYIKLVTDENDFYTAKGEMFVLKK